MAQTKPFTLSFYRRHLVMETFPKPVAYLEDEETSHGISSLKAI